MKKLLIAILMLFVLALGVSAYGYNYGYGNYYNDHSVRNSGFYDSNRYGSYNSYDSGYTTINYRPISGQIYAGRINSYGSNHNSYGNNYNVNFGNNYRSDFNYGYNRGSGSSYSFEPYYYGYRQPSYWYGFY